MVVYVCVGVCICVQCQVSDKPVWVNLGHTHTHSAVGDDPMSCMCAVCVLCVCCRRAVIASGYVIGVFINTLLV